MYRMQTAMVGLLKTGGMGGWQARVCAWRALDQGRPARPPACA